MLAEHRPPLHAHLFELAQPSLVTPPPGGDAALQPMQLDLELGVELFGGARLLLIDRLGPRLKTAEADLRPAQRATIEPQAGRGQPGEESAVMADDDEG